MARLLIVALALVAAGFAWRLLRRRALAWLMTRSPGPARPEAETLVRDPRTGVYRPISRGSGASKARDGERSPD